jgi:hypothetical protein
MQKLEIAHGQGRDDYPVRVMWNLFLADEGVPAQGDRVL